MSVRVRVIEVIWVSVTIGVIVGLASQK